MRAVEVPVDYENLHKERVPLGDGRLSPAVIRRPASAGQPRSRTRRRSVDPGRRGAWKNPGRRSKSGVGTTCGARRATQSVGEGDAPDLGGAVVPPGGGTDLHGPLPKWWSKAPDAAEGAVHRRARCPTECPYVPAQISQSGPSLRLGGPVAMQDQTASTEIRKCQATTGCRLLFQETHFWEDAISKIHQL